VADSVPRGLLVVSNAQRQKSTFSVKKLRKRLKPYRELLGRLVSVSGARRDKVRNRELELVNVYSTFCCYR